MKIIAERVSPVTALRKRVPPNGSRPIGSKPPWVEFYPCLSGGHCYR